jgi:curved DNA-binding protein CbpA
MIPSQRAAEGNYYEEFGVEPSASPEEVRDAFRALVRILHPDQLTDPELKGVAERHLRRMNAIYEVLSDPDRRRAYDASLQRGYTNQFVPPAPAYRPAPRRFVNAFLWAGVVVMLAGTSVWLYFDSPDRASLPAPERVVSAAAHPPDDGARDAALEALRNDLRDARAERDEAQQEAARLQALLEKREGRNSRPRAPEIPPETAKVAADPPPPPAFSPVPAKPGPAPTLVPTAHAATAKALGSDPHQFAGFWFYVQGTERADKKLYLPEFIEAVLTEHNGLIQGRYRSRYQIPDRAISPDVNFQFTGTATGDTLMTLWTGSGGAKGKVNVKLISENTMKFEWTASDLGYSQGLTSGTATLMRRIE